MGKIWGWIFILGGIYIGMEIYNEGMDRALGGIFARTGVVESVDQIGDRNLAADPRSRDRDLRNRASGSESRRKAAEGRVTLPQRLGQRVQGHMDGRDAAIERRSR